MKRKILSALLCVAMTATMLAGCGDKADDSKNSDSDTQQEADNNAGDDKQEAADDAGDSEGGGNKLTVSEASKISQFLNMQPKESIDLFWRNVWH